jgi:hypothetical protein
MVAIQHIDGAATHGSETQQTYLDRIQFNLRPKSGSGRIVQPQFPKYIHHSSQHSPTAVCGETRSSPARLTGQSARIAMLAVLLPP